MVLKTLTPVCTLASVYTRTHTHMHINTCMHMSVCYAKCIRTHIHIHTCKNASMCVYAHTQIIDILLLIFRHCYHYSKVEAIRNGHIASITTTS